MNSSPYFFPHKSSDHWPARKKLAMQQKKKPFHSMFIFVVQLLLVLCMMNIAYKNVLAHLELFVAQ